ncbi:MAG TPA: NAD-dependent epimerase/dehydratase family protein [Candidatus Acidoferrales bacterium]|nr:NAD-dependent epimerase/dehydratase family protein [Candidatus Acidoferrales bacterium]
MINLVTGGAGFLGSHLVDALLARGESVLIVDNLSTGQMANIEQALLSSRATFIYADVSKDPDVLRRAVASAASNRIGCIYHLASPASPQAYGAHPWETLAVNGSGTMALIDLAIEQHARFVYASTSEIYGDPQVHPQPESYFGNVDPIGPRSCYDEGKRFGEAAVAASVRARGLDGRLVRFFNCYGPRMSEADGRLVPALVEAAMAARPMPIHGTGKQTRSMTYVDDAIALLLQVAADPTLDFRPVNIGNDDERSVEEIARALCGVVGIAFTAAYEPARPDDPQRRRPDLTFARSLGWAPRTSLEDGLRHTYEWFSMERLTFA